jgi:hypothetical protein
VEAVSRCRRNVGEPTPSVLCEAAASVPAMTPAITGVYEVVLAVRPDEVQVCRAEQAFLRGPLPNLPANSLSPVPWRGGGAGMTPNRKLFPTTNSLASDRPPTKVLCRRTGRRPCTATARPFAPSACRTRTATTDFWFVGRTRPCTLLDGMLLRSCSDEPVQCRQRIMVWETAKNEGVGFGPLRAAGSRWATALTADPLTIYHHARTAQVMEGVVKEEFDGGAGQRKTWSESMYTVMPVPDTVYDPPPGTVKVPFVGSLPHVHELLVSRLVTGKQVLFSRADYSIPLYGKVNPRCHFPTSQFTHFGLIAAGEDHGVLDFYQDTLGLLKTQAYAAGPVKLGTRAMFDCAPGLSECVGSPLARRCFRRTDSPPTPLSQRTS